MAKSGSQSTALPGDKVTYTVTVVNTGQVDYTTANPASFTDDLSKVLDDATYDDDVTGGASYAAPVLSWSGALAVGQAKTFTYSVTVKDPDTGNGILDNTVVPTGPAGRCAAADACQVTVPVESYTVAKTASQSTTQPGDKVTYTISVVNTGQVDYTAGQPGELHRRSEQGARRRHLQQRRDGWGQLCRAGAVLVGGVGDRADEDVHLFGDGEGSGHRQRHPGQHGGADRSGRSVLGAGRVVG